MGQMFNLQNIFNKIIAGEVVKIPMNSQAEYDSLRSSLLRKNRIYLALLDDLGGPNPFEGKYLKASWRLETLTGTFELAEDSRRQNKPGKLYNLGDL